MLVLNTTACAPASTAHYGRIQRAGWEPSGEPLANRGHRYHGRLYASHNDALGHGRRKPLIHADSTRITWRTLSNSATSHHVQAGVRFSIDRPRPKSRIFSPEPRGNSPDRCRCSRLARGHHSGGFSVWRCCPWGSASTAFPARYHHRLNGGEVPWL